MWCQELLRKCTSNLYKEGFLFLCKSGAKLITENITVPRKPLQELRCMNTKRHIFLPVRFLIGGFLITEAPPAHQRRVTKAGVLRRFHPLALTVEAGSAGGKCPCLAVRTVQRLALLRVSPSDLLRDCVSID